MTPVPWRRPLALVGPGRDRRLGGDRDLRPADRAGQPAGAEFRHPGPAVGGALVRHRRARPGRVLPGAVRRPDHAAAGGDPDHRGHDHRRGDRRYRRVLRRLGGQRADARGRPGVRVPRHHPRAGHRGGAGTATAQRGDRRGVRVLAVLRPAGQEPGAVGPFGSICGRQPAARRVRPAHPVHRHPAQRGRAGAGAGRPGHRQRRAAAVRPLLPRPRRPAAHRRVGGDGGRGRAELQRLVGRHVPRPGHLDRRPRLQLHRRRAARHARPAHGPGGAPMKAAR